jgi:hypothetical protein
MTRLEILGGLDGIFVTSSCEIFETPIRADMRGSAFSDGTPSVF